MTRKNVLTRTREKRAHALFASSKWHEAKALYEEIARVDRINPDILTMLSIVNRKIGITDAAESYSRQAIALQPKVARAHQALGAALHAQGDRVSAIASYRRSLSIDPKDADSHYLLGVALRETGKISEAATAFRKASELRPNFLEAWSNLGAALVIVGETKEAAQALNHALRLCPTAPQVLCNLGGILQREGRFSDALEFYQRALQADPNSFDAVGGMATLLEKTYRLEEAAAIVNEGLKQAPESVALLLVAAKLARRDSRFEEAIEILERLKAKEPSPEVAGEIYSILGQLYDRQYDAARAYQHIVEANRLTSLAILNNPRPQTYLEKISLIKSTLSADLPACEDLGELGEVDSPIFLLGFPRSGTTLLEQVLDSHPALQSLEEKPTVQVVAAAYAKLTQGRKSPLASLTPSEIEGLRETYWSEVARYVERRPGTILIDKMPLSTVHAPLLWRVFPNTKFIFSVRHPCDVCLSCLMQNFGINEAMASFFTIEDTVHLYTEVMSLWQRYTTALPLRYHCVRYEDLVANLEHEARATLGFLEVEWDERVLDHTEHARRRGTINTASYHQVTQPIYQDAKYRWKRYSNEFEPYMDALRPFIKYFGYAEEDSPESDGRTFLSKNSNPSTA